MIEVDRDSCGIALLERGARPTPGHEMTLRRETTRCWAGLTVTEVNLANSPALIVSQTVSPTVSLDALARHLVSASEGEAGIRRAVSLLSGCRARLICRSQFESPG
jgi:hypothetical protein